MDSYEPWGGDFPNRREHRGVLAFFELLNIADVKQDNYRFSLVKNKQGTYSPELSLQDTGLSLGLAFTYNPNDKLSFFKYIGNHQTVNSFAKDLVWWNEDFVKINWTDTVFVNDRYDTTTYSDVKWMVRKIAKLSFKDIDEALRLAGYRGDEHHLYLLKIANRRNQLVSAFELESEFPLFQVPDLATYSPNPNIQNGLLTCASVPDSSRYQTPHPNVWKYIMFGVSQVINLKALTNLMATKINNTTVGANFGGSVGPGIDVNHDFSGLVNNNDALTVSQLAPGIKVSLTRDVGQHQSPWSHN